MKEITNGEASIMMLIWEHEIKMNQRFDRIEEKLEEMHRGK